MYTYRLTLKFSEDLTRQQRGHFIVEQGQDQIWLTASDGTEVSGTALSAARTGGRSVAGFRTSEDKSAQRDVEGHEIVDEKSNKLAEASKATKQEKANILGSLNRVAKFGVSGLADTDTGIREDASGRLGFNEYLRRSSPRPRLPTTHNARLSYAPAQSNPPANIEFWGSADIGLTPQSNHTVSPFRRAILRTPRL